MSCSTSPEDFPSPASRCQGRAWGRQLLLRGSRSGSGVGLPQEPAHLGKDCRGLQSFVCPLTPRLSLQQLSGVLPKCCTQNSRLWTLAVTSQDGDWGEQAPQQLCEPTKPLRGRQERSLPGTGMFSMGEQVP